MRFTLRNAHLVDAARDISRGEIVIDGARIQSVAHSDDMGKAAEDLSEQGGQDGGEIAIDADGMIVMPGFIDVHTHGGGGFNLHTTDAGEIRSYANWSPSTGVTSFLIAVVGVPGAMPEEQLKAAVEAMEARGDGVKGAEPLGIHLEGPYISAARRGAHPTSWLRIPDEAETERLLATANGYLRLMTLAPELPGGLAMITRLVEAGVTVS
ncbi:MAG TPA: amidohydrolase family protein, partial [Chthonomonadales bacterium]|nr:amidohydrolase family protein [Chthonomonadales bacterium]